MRIAGWMVVGVLTFMTWACEPKQDARLSSLGESCLKTADCEAELRCLSQVCTASEETQRPPEAGDKPIIAAPQEDEREAREAALEPGTEEQVDATACDEVSGYLGDWTLTSIITTSIDMTARGVTGYYQAHISTDENCHLVMEIDKTGFSKTYFTPERYQSGTVTLVPTASREMARSYEGRLHLERPNGSAKLDLAVWLRLDGERMTGAMHYLGKEWNTSQMTGGFVGVRGHVPPPTASFEELPRDITCVLHTCQAAGPNNLGFACGAQYQSCYRSTAAATTFLKRQAAQKPKQAAPKDHDPLVDGNQCGLDHAFEACAEGNRIASCAQRADGTYYLQYRDCPEGTYCEQGMHSAECAFYED